MSYSGWPSRTDWWRVGAASVWLPTADEIAALDRQAVSSGSTTERALIENAGREIAHIVQARFPAGPVAGLAGPGHNGADALVALRTLRAWGRSVRAFQVGPRPPAPDVLAGWPIRLEPADSLSQAGGSVWLDGILGTGLRGAPRAAAAAAIDRVNELGDPIVAVDLPSGVNGSTGAVLGACVRATLTVSLGWPKLGLLRPPASEAVGDLLAVEIGFPPPSPEPVARAITGRWVQQMLPALESRSSKRDAGYVTLVAGQEGMAGAAILAARGALRGGAGVLRLIGHPANRSIIQEAVPEAIFVPWDDAAAVSAAFDWGHAIAVGPGLGRTAAARGLVERALDAGGSCPVLLDADGLSVWAKDTARLAERTTATTVLTPHPGEMARITGEAMEDILGDPFAAVTAGSERFGCTLLLKGSPTLVKAPGESLCVATTRGPALAAGGTGDVLAGVTAALLASGLSGPWAAAAALLLTGLAAAVGPAVGHTAADLPGRLPEARSAVAGLGPARWASLLFALPAIGDGRDDSITD